MRSCGKFTASQAPNGQSRISVFPRWISARPLIGFYSDDAPGSGKFRRLEVRKLRVVVGHRSRRPGDDGMKTGSHEDSPSPSCARGGRR